MPIKRSLIKEFLRLMERIDTNKDRTEIIVCLPCGSRAIISVSIEQVRNLKLVQNK